MLDTIIKALDSFSDNPTLATPADASLSNGNASLETGNKSANLNTVLDAWDMVRRTAAPVVAAGLTNRSMTNFDFYLDPSIVIASLLIDQSTLRWTIEPLRVLFGANGLSTAPTVGAVSVDVELSYTPIIGWAIVARAIDTMSGQANFSLTTSSNAFTGSWSLADVNVAGVVFVWQSTQSQDRRIVWGAGTGDGTAPATANSTELVFDPLTSSPLVLKGSNISLDVFPIVLTDSIKRALIYHIANDTLNAFAAGVAKGAYGG